MIEVRVAEAGELAGLVAVEDAADQLFGAYGIVFPPSPDIDRVAEPADVLVVGRPPTGFAHVGEVDDHLHLHQLAVHPEHDTPVVDRNARKGSGPSDHAPLIVDLAD